MSIRAAGRDGAHPLEGPTTESEAPSRPDPAEVRAAGERLLDAFRGLGTDERAVFDLLENEDPAVIAAVEYALEEISGGEYKAKSAWIVPGHSPLGGAFDRELRGADRARAEFELRRAQARCTGKPDRVSFAHQNYAPRVLHEAMARLGTDEGAIDRILDVLSPAELKGASESFSRWFCQASDRRWGSLREAFQSELSGGRRERALGALDAADALEMRRPGATGPVADWAVPPG